MPPQKEFSCRGLNYTVTLGADSMFLRSRTLVRGSSHELPIDRVRAVIVLRKSIVPYAAFTILAAIGALLAEFNALWFLVNLSSGEEALLGNIAILATVLLVVPTVLRALFVDVVISWSGRPTSFLIRFVTLDQGRRLARRFNRLSSGT